MIFEILYSEVMNDKCTKFDMVCNNHQFISLAKCQIKISTIVRVTQRSNVG